MDNYESRSLEQLRRNEHDIKILLEEDYALDEKLLTHAEKLSKQTLLALLSEIQQAIVNHVATNQQ